MKKILWLALIAVLATATTGCLDLLLVEDGYSYEDDYIYEDEYIYDSYGDIEVQDGYLAGDLGQYESFVAPAYEITGQDYGTSAAVEMHGGDDYWVMTRLDIQGGLQHRDLAPGAHLEFGTADADWYYGGDNEVYIAATGCSGPTHGNWDYDAGADRVIVDVEQGPTEKDRVIHFQAEYTYNGTVQVTDGSFGYTVY